MVPHGNNGAGTGMHRWDRKGKHGKRKRRPSSQKKKNNKFSRVFTVLKKFLVNESRAMNSTLWDPSTEKNTSGVLSAANQSIQKKNEAKQELVYFWKEQLVHLQKEPKHVPQQRLITQGCQQEANVPCGPAWRPPVGQDMEVRTRDTGDPNLCNPDWWKGIYLSYQEKVKEVKTKIIQKKYRIRR